MWQLSRKIADCPWEDQFFLTVKLFLLFEPDCFESNLILKYA